MQGPLHDVRRRTQPKGLVLVLEPAQLAHEITQLCNGLRLVPELPNNQIFALYAQRVSNLVIFVEPARDLIEFLSYRRKVQVLQLCQKGIGRRREMVFPLLLFC